MSAASTAPGPPSPNWRWKARSARRTSGIAATTDAPWLTAREAQPLESLGRSHLMNQLAIDVDQRAAIIALLHQMALP